MPILAFSTSSITLFDTADTLPHSQSLGVLYWGYCQYVPAILISPFQDWFYLNYVVSVRYNEKNGWLIAGNNKPTIFKVGTVRTYGKRYIC